MNFWAFKTEDNSLIHSLEELDSKVIYKFSKKGNCKCEEGDRVIFITKKNGKWFFSFIAVILSVDISLEKEIQEIPKEYSIVVTEIKAIEDLFSINDFSYTLLKIHKNYNNPIDHFRGPYSRLVLSDFNAIVNNQIFISRTAFGKTINALHQKHRIAFLQILIEDNPRLYARGNDFVKAFSMLKEYIETYIYPDIIMMSQIGKFLVEINDEDVSDLEFDDPENFGNGKDNIMNQVKICDEFYSNNHIQKNYLNILLEEINNVANDERSFGGQFTNRYLPISIN